MRVVDDDDPTPAFERPILRAVDDVAKLIDADRTAVAGLDGEHVRMDPSCDPSARRALSACVPFEVTRRTRLQAVDRLGHGHGGQSLAHAGRAGHEDGRRHRLACDRTGKQRHEAVMADDRGKRHTSFYRSTREAGRSDPGLGHGRHGHHRHTKPVEEPQQARHERVREQQQRNRHGRFPRKAERLQEQRMKLLTDAEAVDRHRDIAEQ